MRTSRVLAVWCLLLSVASCDVPDSLAPDALVILSNENHIGMTVHDFREAEGFTLSDVAVCTRRGDLTILSIAPTDKASPLTVRDFDVFRWKPEMTLSVRGPLADLKAHSANRVVSSRCTDHETDPPSVDYLGWQVSGPAGSPSTSKTFTVTYREGTNSTEEVVNVTVTLCGPGQSSGLCAD
jgi:hypothetical protein